MLNDNELRKITEWIKNNPHLAAKGYSKVWIM